MVTRSIASVLAALSLASVAYAQCSDATSATMGTPCGTATLDASLPIIGATSTLIVDGTAATVPGILFLSPNTGGSFMFQGCEIFLSSFIVFSNFVTDGNGDFLLSAAVANDMSICGQSFVFQGLLISGIGPVAAGFEVTNAVAVTIGTSPASPTVNLNEIYASHTGADDFEFIELVGTGGASLDGIMILVMEGDESSSLTGGLDRAYDLSGNSMPGDGFFVIGDPGVANLDLTLTPDSIENGTETFYLVDAHNAAGVEAIQALVGTDLDPDDDQVTSLPSMGTLLDIIAMIDADPLDEVYDGAGTVGPDGTFFPPGIFRVGDFPGAWCTTAFLDFDPTGTVIPDTPGTSNTGVCP